MHIVVLGWGFAAFLMMLVSLLPRMSFLNWAILPLAALGLLASAAIAARVSKPLQGPAIVGFVANLVALTIALIGLKTGFGTV